MENKDSIIDCNDSLEEIISDPAYTELYLNEMFASGNWELSTLNYLRKIKSMVTCTIHNKKNPIKSWNEISVINLELLEQFYILDSYLQVLESTIYNQSGLAIDSNLKACLIYAQHRYEFKAINNFTVYEKYARIRPNSPNKIIIEYDAPNSNFDFEKITPYDSFKDGLKELGFFSLPDIANLNPDNTESFLIKLFKEGNPYKIAMFVHIKFIKHLKTSDTAEKVYKKLASLLNISDREVKGNVLVLNDKSTESTSRYTSYKFKEQVIKDYQSFI
jgi:hypothetical protein